MAGKRMELNTEYPAPNEEQIIDETISLLSEMTKERFLQGLSYRAINAKTVCAVRAEFQVAADLKQEFRIGVFKNPGTVYQSWVRFAGTSPKVEPDATKDMRGLSFKLMGVSGPKLLTEDDDGDTHDFLLLSAKTFLASNPQDFLDFTRSGIMKEKPGLGDLLKFLRFAVRKPKVPMTIQKCQIRIASLLEIDYFSTVPFLFGERAVKYGLRRSRPFQASPMPDRLTPNYLRDDLKKQLSQSEIEFDFMIQFQLDPEKQPIEDALVVWEERDSPWHKIGTLRLPCQEMEMPQQVNFGEHLSINPWRCLSEHRPLGGINRMRRKIYFQGAVHRHKNNEVPMKEPPPECPWGRLTK